MARGAVCQAPLAISVIVACAGEAARTLVNSRPQPTQERCSIFPLISTCRVAGVYCAAVDYRKMSALPPRPRASVAAASCLLGRFGLLNRERFRPGPGVLGDVEQHAFGAVDLDLEPTDPVLPLIHIMLAAQRLDAL